jgi:hypothetical protein
MLELGYLLTLAGTVSLPGVLERRTAGLGVALLAVAIAALRVAGNGFAAGAAESDIGFEVVNAGLLLGGVAMALMGAVAGVRRSGGFEEWIGPAAVAAGCVGVLWGARSSLSGAPPLRGGGATLLTVLLGAGLLWTGDRLRPPADRAAEPVPPLPSRGGRLWLPLALLATATLTTAFGSHLLIVFAGAGVAAFAGYLLAWRARGKRVLPVLPFLALLLLPTYWLLATIAGPEGLAMSGLPDVPLSPPAQVLLAPALLLVALGFAGSWPFHRQVPGVLLAPVGALLLARVGTVALPDGMEHWRALAFPIVTVAIWHAALTRCPARAAAGGALIALCSLAPTGRAASSWLLAAAIVFESSQWSPWFGPRGIREVIRRICWVAMGWGGLLALEAGFQAEVVYSILGALGIATGIALSGDQAMTPAESRTGVPSSRLPLS